MKDMLYDRLNDMEIDYEEIPLDDLEKQRLYRVVKTLEKKKKRKKYGNIAKLAAALVMVCGIMNFSTDGRVMAMAVETANQIHVGLSKAMGLSSGANRYSAQLNRPVDINGEKIIVDDIAFDGEDLYAVILSENKGDTDGSNIELEGVKVDGKENRVLGSSGSSYVLDSNPDMVADSGKYTLEQPLPRSGKVNLELEFSKLTGSNQKASIVLDLDMAKMEAPKRVVAKDIQIGKTDSIVMNRFTMSPLAQKIVLTYPDSESDYVYRMETKDSKGRIANFETRNSDRNVSNLYFSPVTSDVTADELLRDVDRLDCQLYRQMFPETSGREDMPEEKVGDVFSITLK